MKWFRNLICIEIERGQYEGVVCHDGGALQENGELLITNYNTREKVEQLLSRDIEFLGKTIEETVFSDAGEKRIFDLNFLNEDYYSEIPYCYVYTLDNEWKYLNFWKQKNIELKPVKRLLEDIYESEAISTVKELKDIFEKLNSNGKRNVCIQLDEFLN